MASLRISRLKNLLAYLLLKSDSLASHTHRLLSTPSGIDSLLCTAYYTLCLLHGQLTALLARKYTRLAETIAQNASKTMLPGETLVATIEPPHLRLTETCASVKSIGDAIEDVRLFGRLPGLLRIYVQGKDAWRRQHRDPAVKALAYMKLVLRAGYQGFENAAFLVRRGVIRSDYAVQREGKWWNWSARFWLAYTGVELLRLLRVRQMKFNEELGAEKIKVEKDGVEQEVVEVKSKRLEEQWWKDLYSILGWLPASIHWSLGNDEDSPISESALGLGGVVPGAIALSEAWMKTA